MIKQAIWLALGAGSLLAGSLAASESRAADSFAVSIRIDAAKTRGELKPIWRFFGADEPNYAYMKDGKKLLAQLGELASAGRFLPRAQPADLGRRNARAQVGLDRRLHRGRRGQAGLRLDDHRPHLRHLSGARRAALRRRSASCPQALSTKPEPYQHHWTPKARYNEIFTGWAYPPKDYDKWARARLSMGEALRRAVRPGGGGTLVLGGLERAEHRLLARHARGVSQAARLRDRRRSAAPCPQPSRRAAIAAGSGGRFLARLPRALPARHELRDGRDGHAARLRRRFMPRARPTLRRWPRADGNRQPAPRRSTTAFGWWPRFPS